MNLRSLAWVVVLWLAPTALRAQISLGQGVTISFASAAEGKRVLTNRDSFIERMSPFDRAARLKTNAPVSERKFLEFVGQNVLEWSNEEKQTIRSAFQGIQQPMDALALPFPQEMLLIKTTGMEEGQAPYTRANAIVLPQAELKSSPARLQKVICHELFHIMSRANSGLRERLYAAVGFAKCNELEFPSQIASRKITNPDAPKNDHCIRVRVDGKEQWAVPVLFSSVENYPVDRGGEFFDYLQFQLLVVERPAEGPKVKPMLDGAKPLLVDIQHVSGFFEQVGRNTKYIIHPEEILADNFAALVLGERHLPSPEVLERIHVILKDKRAAGPSSPTNPSR
ncbi:MAG: hypothetical protein JNN07_00525 [Verrucomicrobiales bacterium]|nr:hypothetical protein [Verrucomicrobiales bacterium]